MENTLAFIDLLGFSNMVEGNYAKARDILNDFYNIAHNEIKAHPEIQGLLVSDSLIAFSQRSPQLVNSMCNIYRACLRKNNEYRQEEYGNYFLLPRGGISVGHVLIEDRVASPNVHKEFIVSPALVHSSKMEKSIKGSRLFIAENNLQDQPIFDWNPLIRIILYDASEHRLYENHTYKDALWFSDLSKDNTARKNEIIDLIGIAISLVKANSKNKSALEHHIGTLRIGLLSYSQYCETVTTDAILSRVIDEFRENKYWMVWVSLFEMVMQSPDRQLATGNQKLVDFYKRKRSSAGWKKVQKYANETGNDYFKDLLNNFLADLNI